MMITGFGVTVPAKCGRIGKSKVYNFKWKRHGKYYEQKRVEVFYNTEVNLIITGTVYVFYGKWEEGKWRSYTNDKTDLLYIRLDDRKQDVINRRVSEDIVLDIGEGDKIVGIDIVDTSKHVALEKLLPVKYEVPNV